MLTFSITKLASSEYLLAFALRDSAGHWDVRNCLLAGVLLLAAVSALWFATKLWQQWYGEWSTHHPRKLFVTLCHAHKLDRNQQWLLMQLAQLNQLPQPSAVFLQPELFDSSRLGPQFAAHTAEILSLRQRLFGADILTANSTQSAQNQP